jgi:outer membrane receptor protein involved in Fe transport
MSASARQDVHSEDGAFFSPRVSALARHGGWTSRVRKRTTNAGVELLATWRRAPFSATATYTYVRAREAAERDGNQAREDVPLTPRHSLGLVGMWEAEDKGRIGRVRLFVNAENLTNVRRSRWDPLLRPDRAADGRWTVDAWAPLDGRVLNGGLRLAF